ncbi:MAG: hypothetical protein SQA66_14790 [Candidatus Fervidibacter sacchari]
MRRAVRRSLIAIHYIPDLPTSRFADKFALKFWAERRMRRWDGWQRFCWWFQQFALWLRGKRLKR